jgi:excisionase family DNA binding protein
MTDRHEGPVPGPDRLAYSVEEAADLLGIGRTYMFRLVSSGQIESFKIGRRRKVSLDALNAFLAGLRRGQQGHANEVHPGE